MPDYAVFAVIAGIVAGLLIGWLVAGRGVVKLRGELAVARVYGDRATELQRQLDEAAEERSLATARIAGLEAEREAVSRSHEAQLRAVNEARELLATHFEATGAKVLEAAQRQFLDRADARFRQSEESAGAGLKALLQPVETTLKRYEESLSRVEKEREGSYRALQQAVGELATSNDRVRREASRLADVMKSSPKARGRWGEEQLKTILETAGLSENVDFTLQPSVSDGERQLRPDCVINLPGGRCIVVDVKCPLVHFEEAFDEENDERRAALLAKHVMAMRSYAADLGRKGYWKQYDLSPDFVVMFVPGEHFLSAAAERAPDLIETAFRSGVVMAATINMLALAKVMAGMWRQEVLHRQAEEIGNLGRELYARLLTMGGHVSKLGKNLDTAIGAYNAFVGSLESNVLTSAERFERLGVDTGGKRIERLPIIETSSRPMVKLVASREESNLTRVLTDTDRADTDSVQMNEKP